MTTHAERLAAYLRTLSEEMTQGDPVAAGKLVAAAKQLVDRTERDLIWRLACCLSASPHYTQLCEEALVHLRACGYPPAFAADESPSNRNESP